MITLVKLSNIYKSYPSKNVLKDLNLKILENEVHGFLGPNGAGKSTLMNIILGLIEADSGSIDYSKDLKIGYMPEHTPLYLEMCVLDYLCFVQDIYNYSNREFLSQIMIRLGLEEYKSKRIEKLSKGYKQRVALAAAICHNPKLLILDEPMVGLDPHAIIQMKDLILELAKDHTIFISSHQLYDLSQMCSTLSIIFDGKIIKHGTLSEIEREVQGSKIIELEVENGHDEIIARMCESKNLEIIKSYDGKFQIKSNNITDIRTQIGQYLMNEKVVILSLSEKALSLEEIFRKLTDSSSQQECVL